MNYSLLGSVGLILLFLHSCKSKDDLRYPKIEPFRSKVNLNDSTFLSNQVLDIEKINNNYLISDGLNHLVYVLNEQLLLQNTIGGKGRGPGEFIIPMDIYNYKSKALVVDAGNGRINVFSNKDGIWKYSSAIPINKIRFAEKNSFIVINDTIYATYPSQDGLIQTYGMDGQLINHFGELLECKPHRERSFMHIIGSEGEIFLIAKSEPVIIKYNRLGNELLRNNLSDSSIFKNVVTLQNEFYQSSNRGSTSNIFKDVTIIGKYLIILFYDRVANNDKLLIFNKLDLKLAQILLLGDFYSSINISSSIKNSLIAYNEIKGSLDEFNLDYYLNTLKK